MTGVPAPPAPGMFAGGPGPDDLILSHFSLGRFLPFEVRVQAAAEAGFSAMGFYVGDYRRLRALGASDADLRAILRHYGMRVSELEALRGWSSTGPDAVRYRVDEEAVLRLNQAVGPADTIQVVGPYQGTLDHAIGSFARLCDRMRPHGLAAAIEFLPEMTNIQDAGQALAIVTAADRPNGGLCVDSWHHFRGANDDELLRSVPAERVFSIQLNDGPAGRIAEDYYQDCTRYRLAPGTGSFELENFLRLLRLNGVRRPISVEVLSDDLLGQSPLTAAQQLAENTRRVIRKAAQPQREPGYAP